MSCFALISFFAQGTQPNPQAQLWGPMGMFAIMGVMFYFALWRPQQKKAKEHEALVKSLKPKDEIVTNSGIVGVIVSVKDKTITLRSEDSKVEVLRSSVADVVKRADSPSQS
ncbi:MAG: preprotein translocase subunit YajC [Limisphaerales bacterium]